MANALLASVDGRIGPPAEATISILDEGLLRGDGAFEVIKLYGGHRVPARRPTSTGSAAPPRRSSSSSTGPRWRARSRTCSRAARRRTAACGSSSPAAAAGCSRSRSCLRSPARSRSPWSSSPRARSSPASSRSPTRRTCRRRGSPRAAAPTRPSSSARTGSCARRRPRRSSGSSDGGALQTPALDVGILDSITRDVLIEAIDVEEGAFGRDSLLAAREAFLASTTREIQPISADRRGRARVVDGPAAAEAKRVLAEAVESERATATA